MPDVPALDAFLAGARVDAAVLAYRAVLLAVDGLVPGSSDLVTRLTRPGPDVRAARRLILAGPTRENGA